MNSDCKACRYEDTCHWAFKHDQELSDDMCILFQPDVGILSSRNWT